MLTIRRILVPVDFSPCSTAALHYAARLAKRFDAELHVLHVREMPMYPGAVAPDLILPTPNEPSTTLAEFAKCTAGQNLERMVSEIEGGSPIDLTIRVGTGEACDVIVDAANTGGHDMIVMGTHGRTGFSRLVMGSVAAKVVRRAPCPVLTIRKPNAVRTREHQSRTESQKTTS